MDIILIAGLWLRNSAWRDVVTHLETFGHRAVAVALPGADDGSTTATLHDQIDAVLAAVDGADRPIVVGHSAACGLAWIAADRRPEAVSTVALVGGFAPTDGEPYADFFPAVEGVMAFPGWEPFEGADSADLDDDMKRRFVADAVAVPEGVSKGVVHLTDERRFDVPVLLICPEYTPDQARGWIDGGDVPELATAKNVEFIDIDTGHWPMITQPAELARILDEAAGG